MDCKAGVQTDLSPIGDNEKKEEMCSKIEFVGKALHLINGVEAQRRGNGGKMAGGKRRQDPREGKRGKDNKPSMPTNLEFTEARFLTKKRVGVPLGSDQSNNDATGEGWENLPRLPAKSFLDPPPRRRVRARHQKEPAP